MSYDNPSIDDMMHDIRQVNMANGWYDTPRPFGDDIALLHSEISEAYEAYRKDDNENLAEEMADIFIRLLDTCDRYDIDLYRQFRAKLEINKLRGYKHGGKLV
jgi:NTP pyrophosphatase (non-canonical NTP hydrolase)